MRALLIHQCRDTDNEIDLEIDSYQIMIQMCMNVSISIRYWGFFLLILNNILSFSIGRPILSLLDKTIVNLLIIKIMFIMLSS